MDIETSYNFRRVCDKLTTSGRVPPDALKALAPQGYEVVVNLLPDTNEHAIPGERDIVEAQSIEYIHLPVDFKQPKRSDFELFADAMDRSVGKKTHVHCAANWRVTAFYSLYQVSRSRWSVERAFEFIQDVWRPAEHPGWSEFIDEILSVAQQNTPADVAKPRA